MNKMQILWSWNIFSTEIFTCAQ